MFGKNKTISVQITIMITIDTFASLRTNQNAAVVVVMDLRSKSVTASLLCMLKRLAATLLGPCFDLCKTLPQPLQPLCDCHFFQ